MDSHLRSAPRSALLTELRRRRGHSVCSYIPYSVIVLTSFALSTASALSAPLLRPPAAAVAPPAPVPPTQPQPESLYVHLPFCRRRCSYCDFAIVPTGPKPSDVLMESYVSSLCDEIRQLGGRPDVPPGGGGGGVGPLPTLRTVYFGGGTPSLVPTHLLRRILDAVAEIFDLSHVVEMTLECDPGTFDAGYLRRARSLGFGRVSLGTQFLHPDAARGDAVLASLGRTHTTADARDAIGAVAAAGIGNWSADLICGLPGVTPADWAACLSQAADARPDHISVYDLQVESGTVFGRKYGTPGGEDDVPSGLAADGLPSLDEAAFMYGYASGYLRARGYEHYEVSSYARPGRRSVHNAQYWEADGGGWYAVGLGAASFVGGVRDARPRAMADYVAWVEKLVRPRSVAAEGGEAPDEEGDEDEDEDDEEEDEVGNLVMTRLRTSDGLDLDALRERHGGEIAADVLLGAELAIDLGLATVSASEGSLGVLRLTDPRGFLMSNSIISSIFVKLGIFGD